MYTSHKMQHSPLRGEKRENWKMGKSNEQEKEGNIRCENILYTESHPLSTEELVHLHKTKKIQRHEQQQFQPFIFYKSSSDIQTSC